MGLSCSGAAVLGLLYCAQPMLPLLAARFRLDAAAASLAVSAATAGLALGLAVTGRLSERLSRKTLIAGALLGGALLTLLAAVAPSWPAFLALRALTGFVLAGAPAASMAYVGEELHPDSSGPAMGFYVASTAFGGMAGRTGAGIAADLLGVRGALICTGALGVAAGLAFLAALPAGAARRTGSKQRAPSGAGVLGDRTLLALYLQGFVLMGVFVMAYNDLGFRLAAAPYRLREGAIAAVFSLYVLGILGSALSGEAVGRHGVKSVLLGSLALFAGGLLVTTLGPLPWIVAGMGVVTFAFFAAHAAASAGVGRRAAELPGAPRGRAAAAYLVSYYAGSSLIGSGGGWAWSAGGWPTVVAVAVGSLAAAALVASGIRWRS